ncbi:MAG: rhodanese-like domain-containing protein [Deltaproteobacteria bacterium]|nr:rhodanese-like domain-containing protein [Deltaproteobacteria bacterium]
MLKQIMTLTLAAAILAPAAALACEGEKHRPVQTVDTHEGAKLSKEGKAVFVDANGAETRQKYGVIPGAVLLTSSSEFDVSKELPAKKDQKLVFYCANEKCGASKRAAERALDNGYVDVAVLPAGIMGWKQAGLPITQQNRS